MRDIRGLREIAQVRNNLEGRFGVEGILKAEIQVLLWKVGLQLHWTLKKFSRSELVKSTGK